MVMGLRNVVILGSVESWLSIYFLNVYHTIHKDIFLDYLKQVLLPEVAKRAGKHKSIIKLKVYSMGIHFSNKYIYSTDQMQGVSLTRLSLAMNAFITSIGRI